jgi:hypothetical protein
MYMPVGLSNWGLQYLYFIIALFYASQAEVTNQCVSTVGADYIYGRTQTTCGKTCTLVPLLRFRTLSTGTGMSARKCMWSLMYAFVALC